MDFIEKSINNIEKQYNNKKNKKSKCFDMWNWWSWFIYT